MPLLEDVALLDPWKRPYHYEPDQLHPKTHIPLIWSEGEDPDDPGWKIANWGESVPRRPVPFWREIYNNLFFYGLVLVTALAVVLFCGTYKYWKSSWLRGLVVVILLLLAFVWVAFLYVHVFTSVLA
jgi:hypothetical protein